MEALVPVDLPLKEARAAWVARFETLYIQALLRRTGGNVTRTAELAGVNRRWLQRLIAHLGLRTSGGDDDR
jgi:DNA-binding NtrC family response regulator